MFEASAALGPCRGSSKTLTGHLVNSRQDEAELALEQGELHYQMEEPVNPLKNSTLVDKLHAVQAAGQESHPQVQYAPPLPGMVADDSHIQRIE
ncbi:unnamed protein product, partial [Durusdinium trenchii]